MASAEPRPPGRGRPRDPEHDRAILRATLELLSTTDYRSLTVDAIAARAGVAKTTLYRRWPRKADLVLDAVDEHFGERDIEETGDPLEDLRRLLDALYRELADPSAGRSWPFIAARLLADEETADRYRSRFIVPKHRRATELLRDAVAAGQLPPGLDLDLIATAVAAPATFQPLAYGEPARTTMGRDLLDLIVNAPGKPDR